MSRRLSDMNSATMPGSGDLRGYNDPQFATDGPQGDDEDDLDDDLYAEDHYDDVDDSWADDL